MFYDQCFNQNLKRLKIPKAFSVLPFFFFFSFCPQTIDSKREKASSTPFADFPSRAFANFVTTNSRIDAPR